MNKDLLEVEKNIRIAAEIDKALPSVFKDGYRSPLGMMIKPEVQVIMDRNLYDDMPLAITNDDIKIWEKVCFEWLPSLPKTTQMIVWWRCSGMGWKRISRNLKEKGYLSQEVHRITLFRYFVKGLEKISCSEKANI